MQTRPPGGVRHEKSSGSMDVNLRTKQQQQQQQQEQEQEQEQEQRTSRPPVNNLIAPSSSSVLSPAATSSSSSSPPRPRPAPPPPLPPPHGHQRSKQHPYPLAPMMDYQRNPIYDAPPHRVAEVYPLRPDVPLGPPREQLPPLSSLFAGPRSSLPSRTSYTDRSPTFPLLSPSHPQQYTPAHGLPEQKSWEATYSPRRPSPPTSSPSTYHPRAPSAPSADITQHPSRPMQLGPATSSPRPYDSRYSPKDDPRTQLPRSRSGWSPRAEPSYGDYFPPAPRESSSSLRLPPEQHRTLPPHPHTPEARSVSHYMDTSLRASSTASLTSDLVSNASSESVHAKDGLGPKIWTGTQFLPRFIRQADVPGEGLCYFYDDGTHCKTHIDGEAVNAHWGVTKAGKPRKRLAIACITCREKKIKCDPDYPRCTQCEKFGRVCKFKNAPRGGQGSPEVTPEAEEASLQSVVQASVGEPAKAERREDLASYTVHSSHQHSSADSEENPMKRTKFYHPASMLDGDGSGQHATSTSPKQSSLLISRRESDQASVHSCADPLDTDGDLVMELTRLYFLHSSAPEAHCMFPERPFMQWLTNRSVPKSSDDLMLIYTLLSMATVYSSNPLHKERGKDFAAIGRYACDQRHYSLQLVQGRLLLALYYAATNRPLDAWDFCGSALRAATGMKLNLEIDQAELDSSSEYPYHLRRDGYLECRRRTFWTCYVLDKLNSFPGRHLSIINAEDVFLHLPCDANSFEAQVEVNNPYFDPSSQMRDHDGGVDSLAYLIYICSIWGDIMTNIYRHLQRADDGDEDPRRILSSQAAQSVRLDKWVSSLPDWLSYSPANLAKAATNGNLGDFITLHSLYHSAQMNLNRHLRPSAASRDQLERSIRTANEHAEALLQMADQLAARPRLQPNGEPSESAVPFSAPQLGHAIISAVDIVTAKGYLSSLPSIPSKINGAMAVLTELSSYWESAKQQRELINLRKMELVIGPAGWRSSRDQSNTNRDRHQADTMEVDGEGSEPRTSGRPHVGQLGTYEMQEPMEKIFARGNDCIYGVSLEVWDRALAKEI